MKYIRKFDDKDEIVNISESFAEGFSVPCSFFVHEYDNYKRYDIHYIFNSGSVNTSEFNQKRKSFENRINNLEYEILYRTNYGRLVKQSEIIDGKRISTIIVMLQKISS